MITVFLLSYINNCRKRKTQVLFLMAKPSILKIFMDVSYYLFRLEIFLYFIFFVP